MMIISHFLFCNEYPSLWVWPWFSRWGFTPTFPTSDIHDSHVFTGMKIDTKICSRATAVFLFPSPVSGNGAQWRFTVEWVQQRNSKIKCGILIYFSMQIVSNYN